MTMTWLMTRSLPTPDLVQAAMDGDDAALDALARAWLPHVYRWCHRLGGPGFHAEDCAHEVLILMCKKLPTLKKPDSFPSWLFGMTRRVMANHRRKAWWKRWVPGALPRDRASTRPGPERSAQAHRAAEQVWGALSELSQDHREILILVELEERTGPEAAALLDLPLGTIKSRLRAARKHFRSVLETTHPDLVPSTAEVS